MTMAAFSSYSQWYAEGKQASYVCKRKSPGGILELIEVVRPGGDMSRPAQPDIVLHQDLNGGSRIQGDAGGGFFDAISRKGYLGLDAPDLATKMMVDSSHRLGVPCPFPWSNGSALLTKLPTPRFPPAICSSTRVRSSRLPSIQPSEPCGHCRTNMGRRRACWRGRQAVRYLPSSSA
jgi:hypothetical protein